MGWGALAAAAVQYYSDRKNRKAAESFSEDMSNTSHQREVADLYAAGLNPILSSKYGGASTPQGVVSNNTGAILGQYASTSLAAKKLKSEMRALDSQAHKDDLQATVNHEVARSHRKNQELTDQYIKTEIERTKHMSNTAKAVEYNLQGLKNEAEIDKTRFGETTRYIKRFIDSISPFTQMRDYKSPSPSRR